jgi:hypothetical protein
VGLERGPLSLLSTTEELLGRKSNGSGLESLKYGRRDPFSLPCCSLYPKKLTLTSPTSYYSLVGIDRSRTQATELLNMTGRWLSDTDRITFALLNLQGVRHLVNIFQACFLGTKQLRKSLVFTE